MSLVAYDASSDEESDYEDEKTPKAIIVERPSIKATVVKQQDKVAATNGHISDEDDDFLPPAGENEKDYVNNLSKLLPKPKNHINLADILENFAKPTFTALPTPKAVSAQVDIEEDDDEFLHKKPSQEIIEKPNKNIEVKKMPVKITIPSLRNFQDVEKEMADKAKNKSAINQTRTSGSSGLLSILPKAKSEQNFAKVASTTSGESKTTTANNAVKPAMPAFVPDAVKHRRPATNTEDIDRIKPTKKKLLNQATKTQASNKKNADSDESGDDDNTDIGIGDFFSFNTDKSLPVVSATEINALVAKKAAKMIETTTKFLKATEAQNSNEVEEMQVDEQELEASRKRYHEEQQLHPEALQALVGGNTKRRRRQQTDIQVIDINSSQVLPNKDEWMRTALASSTTYQPTGVLVDEEPATGTRRKHQITYLAHKAKANEAELQAMWSANRQNRRATQNKYGF